MDFSCQVVSTGVTLHLGEHQGTLHPWWKRIRVELYGWGSGAAVVKWNREVNGPVASFDATRHTLTLEINDDSQGSDLEISRAN
jgi:hypothetical protein